MESNELKLMVGDWVFRFGNPSKVTPNTLMSIDVSPAFAGNIKPIPLTPDILEKIGAIKVNHIHGYSFYTFINSKVIKLHLDIYENKTNYYGYNIPHIKYLHTLQQLIRLFTGKEIVVKWEK